MRQSEGVNQIGARVHKLPGCSPGSSGPDGSTWIYEARATNRAASSIRIDLSFIAQTRWYQCGYRLITPSQLPDHVASGGAVPSLLLWKQGVVSCAFVRHLTDPAFEVQLLVQGVIVERKLFADDPSAATYAINQMHVYAPLAPRTAA